MKISRGQRWLGLAILLVVVGALVGWWRGANWGAAAARAALGRRDYQRATNWLDGTERLFGMSTELQLLRARLARQQGRVAECRQFLELAERSRGDDLGLLREQLLLQAQLGQLRDYQTYYRQLLADDQGQPVIIHEAFAIGLLATGRLNESVEILERWRDDAPRDAQPHYLLGMIYREMGLVGKAREEYREALRRQTDHPQAALELAVQLTKSHRYEEAANCYAIAIRHELTEPQARVGLAHCQRMVGDTAAARRTLQPLIDQPRPNLGAMAELGNLELMDGNYEEALQWAGRARAIMPRNSELNYTYAVALAALGQHGEGEAAFRFAIEARRASRRVKNLTEIAGAHAEDPAVSVELAELALEYGEPSDAVRWTQRALQQNSQYEPARALLPKLPTNR